MVLLIVIGPTTIKYVADLPPKCTHQLNYTCHNVILFLFPPPNSNITYYKGWLVWQRFWQGPIYSPSFVSLLSTCQLAWGVQFVAKLEGFDKYVECGKGIDKIESFQWCIPMLYLYLCRLNKLDQPLTSKMLVPNFLNASTRSHPLITIIAIRRCLCCKECLKDLKSHYWN